MTVAVKMEGISKSFGAVQAVKDVNAEFSYGEITGLVGDNGAGKSTLMKILSGVYVPDKGDIFIDKKKIDFKSPLDSRKNGIEMIYQDMALSPYLDVPSNIFLGREISNGWGKLNKGEMKRETAEILDRLGYEFDDNTLNREAAFFSGGQQQAIAIARSILFKPKILILDEPTASIGVKGRDILHRFMCEFKKEEICMIYITHRLPDVFAVSDKIMIMRNGTVVDVKRTEETTLERTIKLMIGVESLDQKTCPI